MIATGILTVSDRVASGEYSDRSGPALQAAVAEPGWTVHRTASVPDDIPQIRDAVLAMIRDGCQLVLATGGTGIAARDVTPEAVRGIASREIPGFGEAMRMGSLASTPNAILSRSLAAAVGSALVVALPGSPGGAVDCLKIVAPAIPHAIRLLNPESSGDDPHAPPHRPA